MPLLGAILAQQAPGANRTLHALWGAPCSPATRPLPRRIANVELYRQRLDDNKLTGAGLDALRSALADGHLAGLKDLRLYGNKQLGDGGAKVLAAALSEGKLPRLEELRLDGTGMGDEGARALAGALGGAPALKKLIVGEHGELGWALEVLKRAGGEHGVRVIVS